MFLAMLAFYVKQLRSHMLLLHLSDIHFREKEINRDYDQNVGLRGDLVKDVREMVADLDRKIDAILISGDIAFGGQKAEYDYAFDWLRDKLCPAAQCSMEDVIVIPGNHDVDRNVATTPSEQDSRKSLRSKPVNEANDAIIRYVDHPQEARKLFKPIEEYNRFAAKFLCEIGAPQEKVGTKSYVSRDYGLNDDSTLRIWGFNSVLVCDGDDSEGGMFVDPSAAQVIEWDYGVAHLVMCHHPFNWLRNVGLFQERLEAAAQIHLFGHEHTLRIEQYVDFTRLRAGAVHPERNGLNWKPGYNILDVSVAGEGENRKLVTRIHVRQYDAARFIPLPNKQGGPIWQSTTPLEKWRPPLKPAIPQVAELQSEGDFAVRYNVASIEVEESDVPEPPSPRSIAVKMLTLNEADQTEIIEKLALRQEGDEEFADWELALAAIKLADQRGLLVQLDHEVNNHIK